MMELQLLTGSISDLKWFKEHSDELRDRYKKGFIAIKNKSIIEFAPNASILIKKLEKKGENSNLVLIKYISPKGEVIIL